MIDNGKMTLPSGAWGSKKNYYRPQNPLKKT
jgi:hypothetical protein